MGNRFIIAGVDRTRDILFTQNQRLTIEQQLGHEDDCRFVIKSGDRPLEGEEILIYADGAKLFAGIIDEVHDLTLAAAGPHIHYSCKARDYTYQLNQRLVVESYTDMAADVIVRDILTKYCPDFSDAYVQAAAPVVEWITFDYKLPSECFRELCDYVGWYWFVDYDKNVHFLNPQEFPQPAPMIIEPGGKYRNFRRSIDIVGLRNRVYVRGGTMLSDPQVIQWKADGVARIWTLPWPPHEVSLTVGEAAKTVGVENLYEEADFDYMMSFSEKYIRCSSQTSTPAEGTTMSLTARQDIPVITMVEDYASQAAIAKVQGGDGVYEHVIDDDSLTTIQAAEAAGMADLREHANPRVKGSFETEYAVPPVPVEKAALEHSETTFADGILSNVEMTEDGLKLEKTGQDFSYSETSQEDFGQGTLTDVVATSAGDLELAVASTGYGPDACTGGVAISGGDYEPKERAFDDIVDDTHRWQSSQTGAGVNGVAYIGYHFATAKTIKRIRYSGYYNPQYAVTSMALQRSDDGSTWVDVQTLSPSVAAGWQTFDITNDTAAAYWRLLAKSGTTLFNWLVYEIEMMEYIATYKSSGTRVKEVDISGAVATGGTKIEWSKTTPANTAVKVETALSTDGGTTYGAYQEATSGSSIPGIAAGTNLSNARLKIRQTLSTTDPGLTPVLHSFFVNIFGEDYAPLGYYISPALPLKLNYGKITASQLSWNSEGEGITVEVDISLDGGKTWEGWQECEAFGVIPVLPVGMMLSGSPAVRYRITLSTEAPSASPAFSQIALSSLAEVLESRNWRPGQIVEINLPDRGIQGEYLIQRVTASPLTASLWTFRVEFGGRLLGIADFLQALVSAQQKKRYIEPTKNIQKYIYGAETLELSDELVTTTRVLPYICGDPDAICGLVVVSND